MFEYTDAEFNAAHCLSTLVDEGIEYPDAVLYVLRQSDFSHITPERLGEVYDKVMPSLQYYGPYEPTTDD
jgi:hypothetical protein